MRSRRTHALTCLAALALAPAVAPALAGQAPRRAAPAAAPALAVPRPFRVDAGHSFLEFTIPFLYSPVRGRFSALKGTILYDSADVTRSSVTFAIDVASLNTGSDHRDEHLKSEDFFDAARYPRIVFQSRRIDRVAGGLRMTGALTMHGVTRDVVIPFRETHAPFADPHGSRLIGFAGHLKLARKDFNILGGAKHNDWFDAARSATMGDSAEITLEVEGWDTDYGRKHDAGVDAALDRIASEGVAAVTARMRQRRAADSTAFRGGEWDFDQIGLALAARGRPAEALEIFKLSAELFPRSAAAQASLGYALEKAGDRSAALAQYDRALALDSTDTRAMELRRRIKGS